MFVPILNGHFDRSGQRVAMHDACRQLGSASRGYCYLHGTVALDDSRSL
jgi:hypothetical protein